MIARPRAARRIASLILIAAVSVSASACLEERAGESRPQTTLLSSAAFELDECIPPDLDIHRSVVVHDAATLGAGDFSLNRTLQAIIDSSGGAVTTPAAVLEALLDSHQISQHTQPVSGLDMPVDLRPGEAGLDPNNLLNPGGADGMVPVALFNRFDAAPADGSHCGEHRIVYAKQGGTPGRFFVIFEAVLPNPSPGLGLEGCRPVAEFWGSLSDSVQFPDAASRAAALEAFYYNGLPGFSPVVTHSNYGVPLGQVRTNLFVNFVTWQLREFRTSFDNGGASTLIVDTVKDNPLAQYYDSDFDPSVTPPFAGVTDPVLFAQEQGDFQGAFVADHMPNLMAPELSGDPLTAFGIVNGFGAGFPNRFNEFQSISQGLSDDPAQVASNDFRNDVSGGLGATGLSVGEVLNRAGAVTCGGCHQFSNNRVIGTDGDGLDVRWPSSAGFVHVTEGMALSAALENFFLPAREAILETFLCVPVEHDAGVPDAGVPDAEPEPDAGGCGLRPRRTCCFEDDQCATGVFGSRCIDAVCEVGGEGVCKGRPPRGRCWDDADCRGRFVCEGEIICPCGALCIRADEPGVCVDPCAAQEAKGVGACALFLGWAWNGSQCVGISGCSCDGRDCDDLYPSRKACVVDHQMCLSVISPIASKETLISKTAVLVEPEPEPILESSVEATRTAVLSAESEVDRNAALVELESAVEAERAVERDKVGAFYPVRRTH